MGTPSGIAPTHGSVVCLSCTSGVGSNPEQGRELMEFNRDIFGFNGDIMELNMESGLGFLSLVQ